MNRRPFCLLKIARNDLGWGAHGSPLDRNGKAMLFGEGGEDRILEGCIAPERENGARIRGAWRRGRGLTCGYGERLPGDRRQGAQARKLAYGYGERGLGMKKGRTGLTDWRKHGGSAGGENSNG